MKIRNSLTDEELVQLNDALSDGFNDSYLPGMTVEKVELGNVFPTNPLFKDSVYVGVADPFDIDDVETTFSEHNMSSSSLLKDTNWTSDGFWSIPFGFNIEKLREYFENRKKEVISEYTSLYMNEDVDDYSERLSFEQWLEGKLFPYTKTWFEFKISETIATAQWDLSGDEKHGLVKEFRNQEKLKSHFLLGRMVEHYRWKFQYEKLTLVGDKNVKSRSAADSAKPIKAAKRGQEKLDCIQRLWCEIKESLDGKEKNDFLTNQQFAAGKIWDKAKETRPIELLIKKTHEVKSVEVIRKALSELRKQEKI